MRRYLRLYAYFLRFSFSKAMEFRLDFGFRIAMDGFYYVVNIIFYRVLYTHTSLLAGWDENAIMVFVGAYIVIDALHMTIFANNCWWLPTYINRGDLDYHLVRPVSSLFMLSLREFAANSFMNLLMAIALLSWFVSRYPHPLAPQKLVLFGGLLVLGTFLYYIAHMIMLIPVFWTHSGRGFDAIFFLLSRVMERPDRIFNGWVRRILVTVMPFAMMASFPTRALLERLSPSMLLHMGVVTLGLFGVMVLLWRAGLRAYSSASS